MNDKTGGVGLSIALIAIAGFVDAVGYLRLTHFFVSFMSGNSTELAIALLGGEIDLALRVGGIVALFVLGVFIGHLIQLRAGRFRSRIILLLEVALLGLAAALAPGRFENIAPMVLAMGLQNTAWHNTGPLKTSRTYVTGILVDLGEGLADALSGARFAWVPHGLMWLGMVAGALAGAALFPRRAACVGAAGACRRASVPVGSGGFQLTRSAFRYPGPKAAPHREIIILMN